MKVLLYSLNYYPELTGIGKYSGEMAPWLSSKHHQVNVIAAPPYYPEWKVGGRYKAWAYKKETIDDVTVYRCPLYVPQQPKTLTRLIHLMSFALSSFPVVLRHLLWKPDVVVVVEPTFFCVPGALLLAKMSGVKAVLHIQDFEIDAMFGLGMMKSGRIARVVKRMESWFMRRFDVVSTISHSMLENARAKGVEQSKLVLFPNWADINFVNPATSGDALRAEWGFSANDQLVLYAGNMGKKQGLEIVLQAAAQLHDRPNIRFVMVGAGAHVDDLKRQAEEYGLSNLCFKPLQPWARVPEMLAMADVHLVVQRKGAADVVLPSKLTNILSAGGHALVMAEADTELGRLESMHPGIYTRVEPEDSVDFVGALTTLLDRLGAQEESTNGKVKGINTVARRYAEEYLDKETILGRFENELVQLLATDGKMIRPTPSSTSQPRKT